MAMVTVGWGEEEVVAGVACVGTAQVAAAAAVLPLQKTNRANNTTAVTNPMSVLLRKKKKRFHTLKRQLPQNRIEHCCTCMPPASMSGCRAARSYSFP
ncbi:hypothetical protein BDA96_03G425200 [Sorghum bicolor]|uniref:Uncharacterized protein n=1 Tax=Sorghum bicolor TaxID=4558 RepID=A0A921RKC1_SORBI|nr:hypothetical protein BDA96_03G425200 [Sorghum bicolor]